MPTNNSSDKFMVSPLLEQYFYFFLTEIFSQDSL